MKNLNTSLITIFLVILKVNNKVMRKKITEEATIQIQNDTKNVTESNTIKKRYKNNNL